MLEKMSGVPNTKTRKKVVYQYMSANSFRGTAQQRVDLKPLYVHL